MVMFAFLTAIVLLPGGAWGANTENVLYTFQGENDCAAYGSLILDPAGNLYGTTFGGFVVNGEVYELSPSGSGWTQTILHTFAGGSDGRNPVTGLVRDQAGNLYGTTPSGGNPNYGVVYELSPNGSGWTETVLYTFSGGNDGETPYSGLILDQAGNLYGATSQGGSGGNGGMASSSLHGARVAGPRACSTPSPEATTEAFRKGICCSTRPATCTVRRRKVASVVGAQPSNLRRAQAAGPKLRCTGSPMATTELSLCPA